MNGDESKVGVPIKKFVIISTKLTKICYRSVRNHPFVVGILLFFLFLYRSSPFLFSLLVSASPVLVCTAILLGTLLSFGDLNAVPSHEEDEKVSRDFAGLKTSQVENSLVVEEDEYLSYNSKLLRREIVKTIDEEPLIDYIGKNNSEKDHGDISFSSMHNNHLSREVRFEEQWIDEAKREVKYKESENTEIEQIVDLGDDQLIKTRVGVGLGDGEALQTRVSGVENVQAEHFEDYKSAEGSVDAQMSDLLVSLESWKRLNEVLTDSLSSSQDVQHENFEDYKSAEGSVGAQVMDQLEPSLASWEHFDELDDGLSPYQDVQDERFEDYQLAEESSEAQMRVELESSLRSSEQFGSDRDEDNESDSGSDGAESSSPDASMADIIPMLNELDPLIEDEIPLGSDLSRQNSAAKSYGSSIHSGDESDLKEEEGDDGKSEADDDNEDETQGSKEDPEKSAILWTEDDQKNLMDLGTSELERNQRLESLIARRKARKMAADKNLLDLDGMDLPFTVAPISTRKHNPFDFPHDSYDDLGLPPIPGSAPSVMLTRRNPFDLPYDSSEEKPDLTGGSFQQEFMDLTQREAYNQRVSLFRRNETFNLGSSAFDFGRPSRFRPYFIPERTDSDVMSYSSLQRQLSELSESKASSAGETDLTSVGPDPEEKRLTEHDSSQEAEPSSEIGHASLLVEHGNQSSDDLDSLSGDYKQKTHSIQSVAEVELGGASSHFEDSHNDIQLRTKFIEVKHNISSSVLSVPKELHEVEDVRSSLVNKDQSQLNDFLNIEIPEMYPPEPSVLDITGQSLEASDHSRTTEVGNDHLKEPIFDLSPLKKDQFLSLPSSDLQRETSDIDMYHLSRNLFEVEETYVHNKDAENVSQHTEQDANENSFKLNDFRKTSGLDSTEFFSELNQVPGKSQASVVAEDEAHLCIDTSERGFEEKLSDDKVSPGEVDQVFAAGDSSEIYHENTLDADYSSDDTISSGGLEFLEESVLTRDKKEDILADNVLPGHSTLSCSMVELTAEKGMDMEVNQQSQVSNLESHEDNVTENLNFTLDENHFLPHDSNIEDNSDHPQEQEQFMIHRKVDEVGQVTKVDDSVNLFKVQEPQLDNLSDSLQTAVSSSHPEESVTKPIVQLDIEDHAREMPETRHAYIPEENNKISDLEGSIADELVIQEAESDVKEMDETLLYELDAVGDFSVPNMVPNLMNSDIGAGFLGEIYSTTESHTATNVSETKNSNLDSCAEDVGADFLVFEAQSVSDIDAAFKRVSEEVRNSVASESLHVEFTGKEVEVPIPERESISADTEKERCDTEDAERESMSEYTEQERCASEDAEPERIQSDLALLDGQNLDSNWRHIDFEMPVRDAVIVERSGEDVEKLAEEDYNSDIVEAQRTVPETGIGCVEFMPFIDRDNKEIDELPLVEENTSLAVEPIDETESVGSIEFDSFQIDRDIEGVQESILPNAGNPLALESEYVEEMLEVPAHGASIENVAESESQMERNTSQPLPMVEENQVIQKSASKSEDHQNETIESSEPHELDINEREVQESPAFETSDPSALEFEEEKKLVQSLEPESLTLDEENQVIQESASKSEDHQNETIESSEPLELDINECEVQESPAFETSVPSALEFEEEEKLVQSLEPESLTLDEENQVMQESASKSEDHQKETVESSEPLELEINVREVQESHAFEASVPSALELEEEENLVQPLEPESLTLDEENQVIQESASKSEDHKKETVELSEPLELDINVCEVQESPAFEASVPSALELEEEKKLVQSLDPKSLTLEEQNQVIQESASQSDDHKKETVESSESLELDINECEVQESPGFEASVPSALAFEEEKKLIQSLDPESLTLEEQNQVIQKSASKSKDREKETVESSESLELDINECEVHESPAFEESVPSAVEFDEETKFVQSLERESLTLDEESGKIRTSSLLGAGIASSFDFKEEEEVVGSSESEPLLMHGASEKIQATNALQESIPSSPESGEEKEVVRSLKSETLLLDEESEKVKVSPLVRASIASSLESEEEKKVIESLESETLQKDTVVEELREWHVVEESMSLAVDSGDQIERTTPIESHPLQEASAFEQIQNSLTAPTISSATESGDKIMICSSEETESMMIDSDIGKLPELADVYKKTTPAVESEGQLERFYSVGFEFLQMLGDSNDPVPEKSWTSAVEYKDQMDIASQLEDHQLDSQQQPEVDVPNVGSDLAESSNNEVDQANSESASTNVFSPLEGKSEESHLVFSSSSSSSSSSGSEEIVLDIP